MAPFPLLFLTGSTRFVSLSVGERYTGKTRFSPILQADVQTSPVPLSRSEDFSPSRAGWLPLSLRFFAASARLIWCLKGEVLQLGGSGQIPDPFFCHYPAKLPEKFLKLFLKISKMPVVKEVLYRCYSILAMATAAKRDGSSKFEVVHYQIRYKLFNGLMSGKMKVSSLFKDEREKLELPEVCAYCGSSENLSLDHLIARSKGGSDCGDNFVYSCRSCNSSKGAVDVIQWHLKRGAFPPLNVLRRYLKLAIRYCEYNGLMDQDIEEINNFPFTIPRVEEFPPLSELRLFAAPQTDIKDYIKIKSGC